MDELEKIKPHADEIYKIANESDMTLVLLYMKNKGKTMEAHTHGVALNIIEMLLNYIDSLDFEAQACLFVALRELFVGSGGEEQVLQ